MTLSRRDFLKQGGAFAGIQILAPVVFRAGKAFAQTGPDPSTAARNRLIVIFQHGGNDGLNTVIPTADVNGTQRFSVYHKVRPSIAYKPDVTLPLDRGEDAEHALGLNPKLTTLHDLYKEDRVAIVQGVDYPNHSYSHFTSADIWESGRPDNSIDSGWIGRHLDRAGVGEGELRGVGIGYELPLTLRGRQRQGDVIGSIPMAFADIALEGSGARHGAYERFGDHPATEPLRRYAGRQARGSVGFVGKLRDESPSPATGNFLANALLTARTLLTGTYGVECVFVTHPGYDTHATQVPAHEALLSELDQAIEAFYFGTIAGQPVPGAGPADPNLAARTIIVTASEFGRRIGEAGGASAAGTDHGAAAPLFIVGPPSGSSSVGLVPGLHGDHPDMGTATLPADNLTMTADLRRVYQALLEGWLQDPDPGYASKYPAFPGLFRTT